MFKVVFLVRKKNDVAPEEFRQHWRETQGGLGTKIPGVRKYVQNHTIAESNADAPAYDGFAEMWFDSKEAYEQAMSTPEAQAAIADLPNFLDVDSMQSFAVDEVEIV